MKKKIRARIINKKNRELKVPLWLVDGFNGLLALMIYNFILYLSKILRAEGILGKLEESSGYFYLNSAITFGATKTLMILILTAVIGLTFILGIIIGNFVRRHRN
ncbi:MAG: hypothetical protein WC584_01205 [Candidatus Pacearchaeota archaeon]